MAQSSPSELLTFFKRASSHARGLKHTAVATTTRPFTASVTQRYQSEKKDDFGGPGENKKHVNEKTDEQNVQAYEANKGKESRARDEGGVATQQKDPGQAATKKAKEEFPEAPTTIGFQDERGGKGH